MKFVNHPEGYIEPDGVGGYEYVYQYKDHLGNVRISYSDSNNDGVVDVSEIMSEKNYYPFGLQHRGYNSVVSGTHYPYTYNGKEEQNELDLNWLDFGARNYDAALGRWMNPDPLAENSRRWSPYNYAYGNPIFFIDPDGMQATDWYENSEGQIVYDENIKSQEDLDNAGIEGEYIAESFLGEDQNGQIFEFGSDGEVNYVPGANKATYTSGGMPEEAFVDIESTEVDDSDSRAILAGGSAIALTITQVDSPAPGPADVVGGIFELGVLITAGAVAIYELANDSSTTLEFAKTKKGKSGEVSGAEHTSGARNSTKGKHERGKARKARDRGGEKGDVKRIPPRKRPPNWKGPWPPKN